MFQRIRSLDWRLTSNIASLPRYMYPLMVAITQLGGAVIVGLIMMAGIYFSYLAQEWRLAWVYVLTIIAIGFSFILKAYFRRRRPDTPYAKAMWTKTYSFPSGHSFGAIAAYGVSAMALIPFVDVHWHLVLWLVAIVVTLMVGFSRVYLGAHYVLDVVGGWVLGLVYLSSLRFFGMM
ncbi:phosphatase PAP2 family protein [Candidatus Saccharibacteria bacterium]|nr:phosphatase PAP2 family protein [Candidatus Saccharibacteria bacterium]